MTQIVQAEFNPSIREALSKSNSKNWFRSVLTARGFLIVLLLVYLLLDPVANKSDIVASVLAFSLLGILILFTTVTLLKGRSLGRTVRTSIFAHGVSGDSKDGGLFAGERAFLVLKTTPVRIPPFFILSVSFNFENALLQLPIDSFVGASLAPRAIGNKVVFPHRGIWKIDSLSLKFGDQFGFSSHAWETDDVEGAHSFKVSPHEIAADTLPVISSSNRAGDVVAHTQERLGDPFDLKQYHPSDGLKKILWKVYARTGELISRHPESSMTPEGQVIVLVVANKQEDYVCGTALSYLSKIESMELEILVGCEGMSGAGLARSRSQAARLMIDTVWNTEDTSTLSSDVAHVISSSQQALPGSKIARLVVFCGSERAQTKDGCSDLTHIGEMITQLGIQPVFIVCRIYGKQSTSTKALSKRSRIRDSVTRALVFQADSKSRVEEVSLNEFVGVCGRSSWEIILT